MSEKCTRYEWCRHKKYTVGKIVESKMWSVDAKDGTPLCEIHLGKWTPGRYSVRLVVGLGTFVSAGPDTVREVDTLEEAAELAELFLHCDLPQALFIEKGTT